LKTELKSYVSMCKVHATHCLFQLCVELGEVPLQWTTSEIVLLAKRSNHVSLNDELMTPVAMLN